MGIAASCGLRTMSLTIATQGTDLRTQSQMCI